MNTKLSEEEMRRALFGSAQVSAHDHVAASLQEASAVAFVTSSAVVKTKPRQRITPQLTVTLRVGNEFEGSTQLIIHQAETLSTLQAEMDAVKAARKKFKYVDVVSIVSEGL